MFRICRCCQSCWEDCYWNCIEEKYCYDETIANYDEEEDGYATKKSKSIENSTENLSPVCAQPKPNLQRSCSKVHENDLRREIQSNVPILAPEIMSVFRNSQIFNEETHRKDSIKIAKASPRVQINPIVEEINSDKQTLLEGGEGDEQNKQTKKNDKIDIVVQDETDSKTEVILRVQKFDKNEAISKIKHRIKESQNTSTFNARRPASENDIFTISSTPDINPIAFTNLPKYYLETPTIEKYRESVSLQSIQTASKENYSDDFSMPRYYRKSELFVPDISKSTSNIITKPHKLEKSERLKHIRTQITPLNIKGNHHTTAATDGKKTKS